MYNKEMLDIKKLKEQEDFLNEKKFELEFFLKRYSRLFLREESLDALKKIRDYIGSLDDCMRYIQDDIKQISNKINCQHNIIINNYVYYECPICRGRFKEIPDFSKYKISHYIPDYENDIFNIVMGSSSEEEAITNILNYFKEKTEANNKQYIRRLEYGEG